MSIQQLIAGSVAPQQNNLINTFLQAEQIKAYRSKNALAEAQAAELPYEREREAALNAVNIAKAQAQTGKAESETQGSQLGNALKQVELGGQILSGVRDEGSYQWARARAAKMELGTEDWPASFDPAWVQQTQAKGMQLKDQLTAQLSEQKFAEQQKQSGIDNQFQQGALNVAQGRLGVSQGNLGVAQANAADMKRHRLAMENKPRGGGAKAPTGYRPTADGGLEFIPGGPADPANKQPTAVQPTFPSKGETMPAKGWIRRGRMSRLRPPLRVTLG